MTLIAEQGFDVLFGFITEFFTWLEQLLWLLMIVGIIVVIIASVGLGTIVGKVVNKAASEELGEEKSGRLVVEKRRFRGITRNPVFIQPIRLGARRFQLAWQPVGFDRDVFRLRNNSVHDLHSL